MLDPRIYRTGFVAVALAIVVVAFSLLDQPGTLTTTLAPDAFSGENAYNTMERLAHANPDRRPGSAGDERVAAAVANSLRHNGYQVSGHEFFGRTIDGTKALQAVVGVRAGSTPGSIVVISHRDAAHSPSVAELSGTGAMLELARVLAGETEHRTTVLVSTSGSAGLADAAELSRVVPGPIDAVISLGDLAGPETRGPVVIPWSTHQAVAPPLLRNTLATALLSQAGLRPGGSALPAQLAHLALPLTVGEQGPFDARGVPAVTLSLSGDHAAAPAEPVSAQRIGALGRTLTAAADALDSGPAIPSAEPYLLFSGKVVPAWAVRLLVLALMVPVFLVAVDGLARARRRRYQPSRGIAWSVAGALPFLLGALMMIGGRLLSVLKAAPPGPVPPGQIPVRGQTVWLLVALAIVIPSATFLVHRLAVRSSARHGEDGAQGPDPGLAIGVLCVMCVAAFALWLVNPFAAVLVVPALHLWLWLLDPELRPRPVLVVVLLLGGLVAPVLMLLGYAQTLGYGPAETIWNGLLLVAGGQLVPVLVVIWSVLLGCAVAVVMTAIENLRQPRPEEAPVTVRGPVTYAGPGSLGGTNSALRR